MLLPRTAETKGGPPFAVQPPLLFTWGPGGASERHAHHVWQLILARSGEMTVEGATHGPLRTGAVLVAPDAPHAVDARGAEVLILFVDPEGDVGEALRASGAEGIRAFDAATVAELRAALPEGALDAKGLEASLPRLLAALGAAMPVRKRMHPAVRRVVDIIRAVPAEEELSLESLAARVGLSPGRLQHAFRESVGLPLRPYVLWARLLRAAEAMFRGESLTAAAHTAGFADAAHMTRTFRRMFGVTPSELRRASAPAMKP